MLYSCALSIQVHIQAYIRLCFTQGLKFVCGMTEILKTVASRINCALNISECHICPKIHTEEFSRLIF